MTNTASPVPKILHVDNSPAVTGAYKALLSWCLATPEFEHVWVLPQGSAVLGEVRQHFPTYELPFVEIGRSPAKLIGYLPALRRNGKSLARIIDKEAIDLLHANDLYNLAPNIARKMSRRKPKLLVHARMLRRSFPARIYDFWTRWHLKRADAIVAVSEAIKKDWNDDPRVFVAYDPIEVPDRLPAYHLSKSKDEPFRFLYLANYIRGKGQEDALEAILKLQAAGVGGFHVDFYGGTMGLEKNTAYREELEAFVTANSLGALVRFHGPTAEVESVMKSHHALLHFSHSESFGMVCYEALCYGLPVISSDCGGPAEMMQPGVSGLLRPVHDTTGFAADMQSLISDPDRCASLSLNAPVIIRARFGDGLTKLTGIFQGLLR